MTEAIARSTPPRFRLVDDPTTSGVTPERFYGGSYGGQSVVPPSSSSFDFDVVVFLRPRLQAVSVRLSQLEFARRFRDAVVHGGPSEIASFLNLTEPVAEELGGAGSTVDSPGLWPVRSEGEVASGGVFTVAYNFESSFSGDVDLSDVSSLPMLEPEIPADLLDEGEDA